MRYSLQEKMAGQRVSSSPGQRLSPDDPFFATYITGQICQFFYACFFRPEIYRGRKKPQSPELFTDQDVLAHSDPSRIPPRVSIQVPQARKAIENEIADLLRSATGQPSAAIQVSLGDPRRRQLVRIPSTRVVKRKSVGLNTRWLCARCDVVPLTVASFVSIHTARRCGIKVLFALADHLRWRVPALGVAPAFLRSENRCPDGRTLALPPPMVALP